MSSPFPEAALANHIAFLGKTGSGKSNGAKVIVEGLLDAGERVCVIDPTGAWYGLRLDRAGRPSRYQVVIFGGHHADIPISRAHGGTIAEVVATSSTPAVIDTRLMTVSDRTAFFTDFAEALLRKNRGPLHLVIDEAHLFAPQGKVASPQSGEMLHAANNLVSLGRSIGLRIIMISQRPAKLHKDSLTQVETLVAMRVIHPLDREAIEAWIKEWADKEQGREIVSSLPSLPTGDAWIWSPEINFLSREHFPLARTYDSGKAPTSEDGGPQLKPLNLEKLKGRLASIEEEAKANDPKALKAEVARLQRELASAQKGSAPAWPDQRAQVAELVAELEQCTTTLDRLAQASKELQRRQQRALAALGGESVEIPAVEPPKRRAVAIPAPVPRQPSPVRETPNNGATDALTGPQRHLLEGLAWWSAMGHLEPSRTQLAAKIGWKPGGSNLRGRLSECSTLDLIEYPKPGTVRLTECGKAAAPSPNLSETLLDSIRAVLTGPQRLLFEVLLDRGDTMLRTDLADAVGWEPGGSNIRGRLSELSSLELIEYPSRGEVRLQDWTGA